jgi:hypothetical protein
MEMELLQDINWNIFTNNRIKDLLIWIAHCNLTLKILYVKWLIYLNPKIKFNLHWMILWRKDNKQVYL